MSNSIYITGYDSRLRELPEGYTQVEYIESNGTQYIDTGFTPNNLSACEVILSCTSISDAANGCFGAAGANYTTDAFEFYYNGTVCNLGFGDTPFRYTSTISINDILTVRISQKERTVLLNNTQLCSDTPTEETFTCPATFITHALNRAGTIQYYSSTRLYSCKLWDNGILIKELIPCINLNNETGLYDLVSKTFYGNSGTGTFIAGNIISTSLMAKKIQNNYITSLELPEGYAQIEYIESSGTQYIDTGFKHNQNTRLIMDAQVTTEPSGHAWLFDGRNSHTSGSKSLFLLNGSTWTTDYNGSGTRQTVNGISITDRLNIDFNKNTINVNNFSYTWSILNFQSNYNLTLLACNTAGTINNNISAKLYFCKIYDNDILIKNFIPCINPSNEIGLYDLVSKTFYGNSGTGTFIAGPEVENKVVTKKIKKSYTVKENFEIANLPEGYTQVEYIESTGTQYINTGIQPNQDTTVYMDTRMTVAPTLSSPISYFGARKLTDKIYYSLIKSSSQNMDLYWQFGSNYASTGTIDYTLRRNLVTNKNNAIIDGVTTSLTYTTFDLGLDLYLFSSNDDNIAKYFMSGEIYSCSIYDNDILVRDFIPCISPSNEAGMYDLVNNIFYSNSGTGTFIAGPTYKKITKLFYEGGN